jgi:hypothetical protein
MICLRCGCCCFYLDISIVNPGAIRQDGTIDTEHCEPMIFKPKGQLCPHLVYLEDKASCKIHELECYGGTPCEQFEQLGRGDDVCVMNSYYRLFEGAAFTQWQSKCLKKDTKAS